LELLQKENLNDYIRAHIFEAFVQLSLHNVILPATIKSIFNQILDNYLERIGTNGFIPSLFLTLILTEAIKLNDVSLIYKAKPFFDHNLIDLNYNGDLQQHIEDVEKFDIKYDFPVSLEDLFTQDYINKTQTRPVSEELNNLFN